MREEVAPLPSSLDSPACPPALDTVPLFDDRACGSPTEWGKAGTLSWSHELCQRSPQCTDTTVGPDQMLRFLSLRLDAGGRPISELFGRPGWVAASRCFRLPWKGRTSGPSSGEPTGREGSGPAGWQRAWYGVRIETPVHHRRPWPTPRPSASRSGGPRPPGSARAASPRRRQAPSGLEACPPPPPPQCLSSRTGHSGTPAGSCGWVEATRQPREDRAAGSRGAAASDWRRCGSAAEHPRRCR